MPEVERFDRHDIPVLQPSELLLDLPPRHEPLEQLRVRELRPRQVGQYRGLPEGGPQAGLRRRDDPHLRAVLHRRPARAARRGLLHVHRELRGERSRDQLRQPSPEGLLPRSGVLCLLLDLGEDPGLHLLPRPLLVPRQSFAVGHQDAPLLVEAEPPPGVAEDGPPLRILPDLSELGPGDPEQATGLRPIQRGEEMHRPPDLVEVLRGVDSPVEDHDHPLRGDLEVHEPLGERVEELGEHLGVPEIAGIDLREHRVASTNRT